MTTIDTLKMAAKGRKIRSLIGLRVTADAYDGPVTGVVESIAYNLYPVLRLDNGQTFRAGNVIELI